MSGLGRVAITSMQSTAGEQQPNSNNILEAYTFLNKAASVHKKIWGTETDAVLPITCQFCWLFNKKSDSFVVLITTNDPISVGNLP